MSEQSRHCQAPKCGRVIVYKAKRFAWVHQSKLPPGDDHAPVLSHHERHQEVRRGER